MVEHEGGECTLSGKGRASYLGASQESGSFTWMKNPGCGSSGTVTLKAKARGSLTLAVDWCNSLYRVESGTGEFAHASGHGSWNGLTYVQINGREPYSDTYQGTLNY